MVKEERPIDRGWAWVICVAVATCLMFYSGPQRSNGILFIEVQRHFNTSGTVTSLVITMISVGLTITSPVAATLGERYGQRRTVMLGSLLMALAAFLTGFAPNGIFVAIVFGGLTGLGLGCIFTPSITMVGYYFDRRRSLANGISSAGGSVGHLTIPVLFTYLLDEYSFQGGLLIYSALLLHVVPAAMLIRPISCYAPVKEKELKAKNPPEDPAKEEGIKYESGVVTMSNDTAQNPPDNGATATEAELKQPLTSVGIGKAPNNSHAEQDMSVEEDNASIKANRHGKLITILCFCCNLYDWKMFKDSTFVLYCLSVSASIAGYESIGFFLPPFAEEKGIPKYNIALLLSIAGFVTLFGRIGGGWFGDLNLIAKPHLAGICLIIVGVSAALLPIFPVYPYMVVYAVMLGFFGGMFTALIVSVVIDLLGIDKMSSAFGLAFMISGLVTIPLPLLLGLLKDVSGTFDWSIWLCSLLLFIGGGTSVFTQYYVNKRKSTQMVE